MPFTSIYDDDTFAAVSIYVVASLHIGHGRPWDALRIRVISSRAVHDAGETTGYVHLATTRSLFVWPQRYRRSWNAPRDGSFPSCPAPKT